MDMHAKKKRGTDSAQLPGESKKASIVFHAMRNGKLYRSLDGVTWELETDPNAPVIPEGTSRITSSE
jgi:hypothetical protein